MENVIIETQILSFGSVNLSKITGKYSGRSKKYSVAIFFNSHEQPELHLQLNKDQAYKIYSDVIKNDLYETM